MPARYRCTIPHPIPLPPGEGARVREPNEAPACSAGRGSVFFRSLLGPAHGRGLIGKPANGYASRPSRRRCPTRASAKRTALARSFSTVAPRPAPPRGHSPEPYAGPLARKIRPAVHVDRLPGHITGIVGAKIGNRGRHV